MSKIMLIQQVRGTNVDWVNLQYIGPFESRDQINDYIKLWPPERDERYVTATLLDPEEERNV